MKQENRFETGLFESAVWQAGMTGILRVLKKGAKKGFKTIMKTERTHLKWIRSQDAFDKFHHKLVEKIRNCKGIQQNKTPEKCSYGHAQKLINIFLKYYVYWYNKHSRLKRYLHCPLDSQLMNNVYDNVKYKKICDKYNIKPLPLSQIKYRHYKNWQEALSKIRKEYHPKRKYVIELDIMFWPKEND